MTRAFLARPGAGIDGLELCERETPEPGPGEALVRVEANSLSFRELLVLAGRYVLPVRDPLVPLSDGAGVVEAVGDGVTRVREGDRVMGSVFARWHDGPLTFDRLDQLGGSLDGLLADCAVLPADALVRVPAHLSTVEASTLPCTAVTAWNALTGGPRAVRPGDTVVTLGSGGVSLSALQLAKAAGARVIATTSDESRARQLRELGADEVIDYVRQPDWPAAVRELTAGRGADRVVDVAGSLSDSLRAVAFGGEVALVGFVGEDPVEAKLSTIQMFASAATIRAIALGHRRHAEELVQALETTGIKPVVDRVFEFEEAPAALRYYEAAKPLGKVVIGR